jgi:hypothetical protein
MSWNFSKDNLFGYPILDCSLNKKNYDALILINLTVEFEPCVLNLIQKEIGKRSKKEEKLPNFYEFWSKEV